MSWWESDVVYLKINDDVLPVEPHRGYEVSFSDYDSISKTEAGTSVRWVGRLNIPTISVNFDCDLEMLVKMRSYKSQATLNVKYFDPNDVVDYLKEEIMFVSGYKEKLLADTNDKGIWNVSFTLEDIKDV